MFNVIPANNAGAVLVIGYIHGAGGSVHQYAFLAIGRMEYESGTFGNDPRGAGFQKIFIPLPPVGINNLHIVVYV
jgi:hypothetical protein